MMRAKELLRKLVKISPDTDMVQKACVATYVRLHGLNIAGATIVLDYLEDVADDLEERVVNFFKSEDEFPLSLLVEIFELIVPYSEKKSKGVTYTPENIKKYILQSTAQKDGVPHICDPSCGCGSFLLTAAECLHDWYSLPYKEIVEENLFGADISPVAVAQTRILLSLLALSHGEGNLDKFNVVCGDMLDKNTVTELQGLHPTGFDCVVGNPPYVRSKNIAEQTKQYLSSWETARTGNVDLYIPFFEVGLSLLNESGTLGYITPNTYMQAVNGRALRNFISEKKFNIRIVDFRDAQVFEGATNYTCITLIDKGGRDGKIEYCRLDDAGFCDLQFSHYATSQFSQNAPWRLTSNNTDDIIYKIEHAGIPISHWKIRNGLATLKNDLFFFSPAHEDENYYYREYNGKEYRIEKNICIKVAKPNVLKNEQDLANNKEVAIFPYNIKDRKAAVIDEPVLKEVFPGTYRLLLDNKQALQKRDKGKGRYEAWYAYGRTQGMNNFGKKLLIPYISGNPVAILSTDENLLFYCGYALFSDDEDELKVLKIFLESAIFWYYIEHTSKPYSKGYMSFAKNYIQNFSIPNISESEKDFILSETDRGALDEWVSRKYHIYAD